MAIDPAWIALIGTVLGGVGLKIIEHWLGKNRVKIDDAARIRDELRIEITDRREEIRELEAEVEKWRGEYYALRDKYIELQTELTLALARIKDEATEAQKFQQTIDNTPPPPVE